MIFVFQENVAEVDGEFLHENMTIDFAGVKLKCFRFHFIKLRWSNVVDEVFSSGFNKICITKSRLGEVVIAGQWYQTPIEVVVVKAEAKFVALKAELDDCDQIFRQLFSSITESYKIMNQILSNVNNENNSKG